MDDLLFPILKHSLTKDLYLYCNGPVSIIMGLHWSSIGSLCHIYRYTYYGNHLKQALLLLLPLPSHILPELLFQYHQHSHCLHSALGLLLELLDLCQLFVPWYSFQPVQNIMKAKTKTYLVTIFYNKDLILACLVTVKTK